MTGEIAQACRFTSFGNAYLRGAPYDDGALRAGLAHVHALEFVANATWLGLTIPRVIARTPAAWFAALRARGTQRLALLHGPPEAQPALRPALAAFAGGAGAWLIAAHEPARTTLWKSAWELADVPRGSAAPWDVTYSGVTVRGLIPPHPADLIATSHALDAALGDAIAYAIDEPGLARWIAWFERARAALKSADPEAAVLAPAIHPIGARQLVAAAQCAWVFGGMMSWNDYGAPDPAKQARYAAVSAALFASVIDAILACVNALL